MSNVVAHVVVGPIGGSNCSLLLNGPAAWAAPGGSNVASLVTTAGDLRLLPAGGCGLMVKGTTGFVGVGGITAPGVELDVSGAVRATSISGNGAGLTAVPWSSVTGVPTALSGGTTWMIEGGMLYYTAGSVGIGSVTPVGALDVSGTLNATYFVGDGSSLTNIPFASLIGAPTWGGGGSGAWTQDGTIVYYTSGFVGIGTPTPSAALDVIGSAHVSGYVGIGTANGGAYALAVGGPLSIAGASTMTGAVGIATAPSSTYALDVSGSMRTSGSMYVKAISGIGLGIGKAAASSTALDVSGVSHFSSNVGIGVTPGDWPGDCTLDVSGLTHFGGNVGVGTAPSSSGYALDVNGSLHASAVVTFDSFVCIGMAAAGNTLDVSGTVSATAFAGDGSSLVNIPYAALTGAPSGGGGGGGGGTSPVDVSGTIHATTFAGESVALAGGVWNQPFPPPSYPLTEVSSTQYEYVGTLAGHPYGDGTYTVTTSSSADGSNTAFMLIQTGANWSNILSGSESTATAYNGGSSTFTGEYLQFQLPTPIFLNSVTIGCTVASWAPTNFAVFGSLDGTNWTLLTAEPSFAGFTNGSTSTISMPDVAASAACTHVRFAYTGTGMIMVQGMTINGSFAGIPAMTVAGGVALDSMNVIGATTLLGNVGVGIAPSNTCALSVMGTASVSSTLSAASLSVSGIITGDGSGLINLSSSAVNVALGTVAPTMSGMGTSVFSVNLLSQTVDGGSATGYSAPYTGMCPSIYGGVGFISYQLTSPDSGIQYCATHWYGATSGASADLPTVVNQNVMYDTSGNAYTVKLSLNNYAPDPADASATIETDTSHGVNGYWSLGAVVVGPTAGVNMTLNVSSHGIALTNTATNQW